MDIKEVLQFIDDAVFAKTGKHLNNLQRTILEGTLNHQKYADIANAYDRTEGHVRDVAYKLLKLLSHVFDEPVSKGNLQSVLERKGNINFSFGDNSINNNNNNISDNIIGSINIGSEHPKSTLDKSELKRDYSLQNKQIAKIKKLRKCGLGEEEIAELLEISLELVKNIETGEWDSE
jgi:DNA-binding transcriptional regulator YiaG